MELQNNKSMETRYFNIEYKSLDNNEIQGTASSLNSPYDMGGFDEVIDIEAFDEADFSEAAALFNHDQNIVLGRVKNNTLKIERRGNMLVYTYLPPDTSAAKVQRDRSGSSRPKP